MRQEKRCGASAPGGAVAGRVAGAEAPARVLCVKVGGAMWLWRTAVGGAGGSSRRPRADCPGDLWHGRGDPR